MEKDTSGEAAKKVEAAEAQLRKAQEE